ncbi:unnamed protein product [Lupinus luteus]|uniref:Uncharacterized protein n=1 Tax=Lupinus luteus TaxID=3873 RepID=A0AAV1Y8S1_LUPLU
MIAISFGYHHQSQFLSIIFSDYHFIDLVSSIHFGCRFHHGSFLFTGSSFSSLAIPSHAVVFHATQRRGCITMNHEISYLLRGYTKSLGYVKVQMMIQISSNHAILERIRFLRFPLRFLHRTLPAMMVIIDEEK